MHNHGPPIPPEGREALFDPFRRGAQETVTAGSSLGLGLGLFIVDQIARAHGGSVRLDSDDGGTTFTVSLPRCAPAPPA